MINEHAKKRILSGEGLSAQELVHLFDILAEDAQEEGEEVGQLCMSFLLDEDTIQMGEWVPQLWLTVRKVTQEEPGETP